MSIEEIITKKRLMGELKLLEKNRESYYQVIQDDIDIFKFYFLLKGDDSTDYKEGYYIGTIVLPNDYPKNPGDFYMLTPSGRFKTDSKICLTNSGYHKESWTPTWSIKLMVIGFISIFATDETTGISHIKESPFERRVKAKQSVEYNLKYHRNIFVRFNQFVHPDGTLKSDEEVKQFIGQSRSKKNKSKMIERIKNPITVDEKQIDVVIENIINDMKEDCATETHQSNNKIIPTNYQEWIDYIKNSTIDTFDYEIFSMRFNKNN